MFCKKCGNEISASDKFCAKCGDAINFERINTIQVSEQNSKNKNKKKLYIIITICVIAIGVLCALLLNLDFNKEADYRKDKDEKANMSVGVVQEEDSTTNSYSENTPDAYIENDAHKINKVYAFSDNYAWVYCETADDNDYWVCIDTEGNGVFEINDASSIPEPFEGGVAFYKDLNGNNIFINNEGKKVFSSKNLFDDIISSGDGYFAVYKYINDFDKAGYEVFIINSEGDIVYRFSELFESIPDVTYLGDGVFSYKNWESMAGSAEYLFINAYDGNAFNVGGISATRKRVFKDGVGFVLLGTGRMGDKPALIYKDGTVKELDITDYNFYKYGDISDGGFVLTSYYDTVNAVYFYDFLTGVSFRLGTFAERVDIDRINQLYFDNGYMLLPLLGADQKRYFTVLDKSGNQLFEPLECVDVRSIGEDIIQIMYTDKVVFANRKGETIFESAENSEWLQYDCGYAVVYDDSNYIDTKGNLLFENGIVEIKNIPETNEEKKQNVNYYSNINSWNKPYGFADLKETVYYEYGRFTDVSVESLGTISAFEVDCDNDGNKELLTVSLLEAGNNKLYISPKLFSNKNNITQLRGVAFSDSIEKAYCPVIEFGNNNVKNDSYFSIFAFVDKGKLFMYYDVKAASTLGRPEYFSNVYIYDMTDRGVNIFKHYYCYEEEKTLNIRSYSIGESVSGKSEVYDMKFDINTPNWSAVNERELEEWNSIRKKQIDEMISELEGKELNKYLSNEENWITNSYIFDESCSYFEENGGTAKRICAVYGYAENDQYKINTFIDYTDVRSKINK